ncbi:MAG: hypothetical protein K2X77_12985 [Candidatus Obscuribacterales bacterium]|jgi:hypothetical protein|nr:hypothetical protein [Candidatus Obscuribacterales bacterium]
MPISWGRAEKVTFSNCGALDQWVAEPTPAVYAVTYQKDPLNKPKSHTVLFFGESEDLAQQQTTIKHQVCDAWNREGGHSNELFVFVCPMKGSTKQQRIKLQQQLVLEYQPRANVYAEDY